MPRILVTGATGFIGQHLVAHLLATGREVSILVREAYGMGQPLPPALATQRSQLQVVYADLRNFALTARAVRQAAPEAVIHLAAAGVTDPFLAVETALRHNLTGTLNLLRACFPGRGTPGHPVGQCIVGRTPGELVAMNPYAASKAAAWQFCQMYARTQAWPIHGAMIFQAYGPGQPAHTLVAAALAAALAGRDFPMTAGTQARDWIHVADVAQGLAAFPGSDVAPGTTLDLGTGELTTLADVVSQIYTLVGRGGQPRLGALPSRPGEAPVQQANSRQTRQLLHWQAVIPLETGLKSMVETACALE